MPDINFTGKVENKKRIKTRTKKRLDTTPLKRTKKLLQRGSSIKNIVSNKVKQNLKRSNFLLFRETSINIISTLDKLNRFLSFENINKKTNNKQFHDKLLRKKIEIDNYYQNIELNEYLKLSYRISGSRTSKYDNPYYLCTTYKQGSIALIKALKYIGKTFRLGPRMIYNLTTFSTKGMKQVYNEFFDKNENLKKKYRNNENVICYISKLITYFHNLNKYIHEFKMLYDNLKSELKLDLSNQELKKYNIQSNYIINDYINYVYNLNKKNTYSGIQNIDYRNVEYKQFPENLKTISDKLIEKYQILNHSSAIKLNKKNKLHLITNRIFNYTTQKNKDGKIILVPKSKDIIKKYKPFLVNILISRVFQRLQILQSKIKIFYDTYTFPDISDVVKYYTGKKAIVGQITLFKSQRTDTLDDKAFFNKINQLSDEVDSKLNIFLNYLNTKVYDLDDSGDNGNFDKYKIIIKYQKIVNYLKKIKLLFSENTNEGIRKDFINQVFNVIVNFIKNNNSLNINYFGYDEEIKINIKKSANDVDMIDTINKQFKLEKQLNKDLINEGNKDEINKFFDGVIIYFNKSRAEYEGLRGDLVETTAIKSVQQSGGANLCYPTLTKENLRNYYDKLMELCNKNILLKEVKQFKKQFDIKLKNSKGDDRPIGLESKYIKVNFRNYILKIMMGNIYFDEDMIHSKLPFKDDIDRALQFIPYYIQGQYFKVGDVKDKYTQNFSNFVYLSDFVNKKTNNYASIQQQTRLNQGDLDFLKGIRADINKLEIQNLNNLNIPIIPVSRINLNTKKNELEDKLKEKETANNELEKLKKDDETFKNELQNFENTLAEIEKTKSEKEIKIKKIQNDITSKKDILTKLNSTEKKDNIIIEISKLEAEKQNIGNEIDVLTTEINELKSNISEKKKQIATLNIKNKEEEITKLNEAIDSLKNEMNSIQQNTIINEINSLINSHKRKTKVYDYTQDDINNIIELCKKLTPETNYTTKINQFQIILNLVKLVKNINSNIGLQLENIKNTLLPIKNDSELNNIIKSNDSNINVNSIIEKIETEQNVNCPKYKTSKYPLSFANLSLLTPLEIASLNGLDDAGNLQVIMGEKGFEVLNKRLQKGYTQRFSKFFGSNHMKVDIKIEIKGEDAEDGNKYKTRYLTSNEMNDINSIIKTIITSRGGDNKSKLKFGAGILAIAGILSMANPILSIPFVIGVLLNNRNRRELYKYKSLEQVLTEFKNRIKKNSKILTFYNTEIKNKGLEDVFNNQVKGYFNLSRNVKFHDLYLHNNIEGYQDHKTTTEDILNNLIFLSKKGSDTNLTDEIILKGRGLSKPYRFIYKSIASTNSNNDSVESAFNKDKLKVLAKSVIIRLLERKNTKLKGDNLTNGGGIKDTIKSGLSSAGTSIYEFGVENIKRADLPYTHKFNKIDDEVKKDLLDVIRKIKNNYKPNSSLEKFIYNIFTDNDLDMYGRDVLYAEEADIIFKEWKPKTKLQLKFKLQSNQSSSRTESNPDDTTPLLEGAGLKVYTQVLSDNNKKRRDYDNITYELDKIILLLGLNRIVESLLYYLENVNSIKKKIDETMQLFSRGTTKKHNTETDSSTNGTSSVAIGGTLDNAINAKKKQLENNRLGDIQNDVIGKSSTLQHLLLRKSYNGMSEGGLIDGIDGVVIKMILYYRNNLLDLQQSENLIRQEFPNITKDLLRKYFHKVLTKLLVYLRCNEISYDYFHSSHYHLSKETKEKKQEQETKIAELKNDPLEILNGTGEDLEKNAELTAKILITEIQELNYISSSSNTYIEPEIEEEVNE